LAFSHQTTSVVKTKPLALAAALLTIGVAACGTPPTAQSLVSQGLKAQLAGDESTAESTYQQAIKLDPNNAVAHYNLGTVYDRQGNTSQAVTEYTATLVISPSFTDALFNLAVDTATSDPAGAQRLYLRVLALQPTFAAAWLNLGFIVRDEGKLAEAKTDWAKAVALDASLASHVPTPAPTTVTKPVTPPSTSQP
jgi:tetratricopeptide (TPR) repeat protein